MSFTVDLTKFANATVGQMRVVPRKIALDILRRLVMRTPVDTGRARGNWQVSVGSPAQTAVDATDKGGGATIEAAVPTVEGWDASKVAIFLMNNVPYISALEDGHSDQAPSGMVKITLAEFDAIVDSSAGGKS